jgi:hypothetical protein
VNDVFKSLVTNSADTNTTDAFNVHSIHETLIKDIELGCNMEKPNVVILETGDKPSSNQNILETCTAYFQDLKITNKDKLDILIWADQAIHQQLLKIQDNHEQL